MDLSEKLIIPEYPGTYEFMVGSAPEGQVRLAVTHSILMGNQAYKNFPLNLTIAQFKEKLQLTVGTEPRYMKSELKAKGKLLATLDDDKVLLSSFEPKNGYEIHVEDNDPNSTISNLIDISQAPKYEMSEEDYDKRANNVRKLKEQEAHTKFKIGDQVEVHPDEKDKDTIPVRKGIVQYVGPIDGSKGVWVGVRLDEPLGKNDGSVKGKRYFTCEANHGSFVRTEKVQVFKKEEGKHQHEKQEI